MTSIEPGANGVLWLSLDGSDQFGKITTDGVASAFSLPTTTADSSNADISMSDLIEGSDGSLWFVDSNTPQVGTLDLTNALLASSDSVSVPAGSAQTSTFASFTDFSGASTAADYTATITLDDGTTLTGTIAANSTGGFDVTASNTWKIGYEDATVTITDTRDTSRVATTTDSVNATAPTATGTGIDVSPTAGEVFTGTVASFTGVTLNSLSSYSATIDWGDGHDTTGTITANDSGGIDVSGTHAYADSGSFTVTTTLSPYPTIGIYPPIAIDPIVPIGPIVHPLPIVTPGGTFTAGGTTTGAAGLASQLGFAGSGSTNDLIPVSTGTVKLTDIAIKAIGDPISILPEPIIGIGPYGGYGAASATSTATVAAGAMTGTGYSVLASSASGFNGVVADFTLTDPSADLSHLHATIDWNDDGIQRWFYQLSNPPSAGVITPDGNGGFTVSASTNFANGGLYHFVVTITDDRLGTGDGAQVGVADGQVVVASPRVWLPILYNGVATPLVGSDTSAAASNTTAITTEASNPVRAEKVKSSSVTLKVTAGQSWSGTVGKLSGIISGRQEPRRPARHHPVGRWDDFRRNLHRQRRRTSPSTGAHTFAQAGTDSITVDLTQTLYSNGTPRRSIPCICHRSLPPPG